MREDTASLGSELGAAMGTRAPDKALRVRVTGKTVRRPRRACERRVLANILRDARAAFFRSSPYHVPHRFPLEIHKKFREHTSTLILHPLLFSTSTSLRGNMLTIVIMTSSQPTDTYRISQAFPEKLVEYNNFSLT